MYYMYAGYKNGTLMLIVIVFLPLLLNFCSVHVIVNISFIIIVTIRINVKKCSLYIHTVNGDGSKTAKIIKRQC